MDEFKWQDARKRQIRPIHGDNGLGCNGFGYCDGLGCCDGFGCCDAGPHVQSGPLKELHGAVDELETAPLQNDGVGAHLWR